MSVPKGKIAVIGSGLIGRSWCMLFVSAGYNVALFDIVPEQVTNALKEIQEQLGKLERDGLLRGSKNSQEQFALIEGQNDLQSAIKGALYVQECTPEVKDLKEKVFLQLDNIADAETILGSSSSAIPASLFTQEMEKRKKNVIIAHPVNPPYHQPLVELVPAPWTDPEVITRTRALMTDVGQSPVTLNKEIPGFIQPRIQYALIQECLKLVIDDVISVEDIDKIFTEGMGMRYSFMGPFETIHLNAEGVNSYLDRYADMIFNVSSESGPMIRLQDDPRMETVFQQLEALTPLNKLAEKRQWRDEGNAKLNQLRKKMDEEGGK